MSRRARERAPFFAAIVFLITVGVTSLHAQPVDTQSFKFVPPSGWKADLVARPITVAGPAKEVLQLSAKSVAGPRSLTGAGALRMEIEAAGVRSIERVFKEERMKLVRPASRRQLANGTGITELEGRSADGKRTLVGFVVSGPSSVILATLAVPGNLPMSVVAVRKSLEAIEWK